MFTARTLKPGLSEEDCPITTLYENKRLPIFFAYRPITFINMRAVSSEVR